jgi:hypothetical protein
MRVGGLDVFGRRAGVAALLLAALSAGGCGSGGGHKPVAAGTPSASAGEGRRATFAAYNKCLEEHGMPAQTERPFFRRGEGERPSGEPRPTPDPAQAALFFAARQACVSLRPMGGLRVGGLHSETRREFRRCMREHGVDLPRATPPPSPPPGIEPSGEPTAERGGMLAGLDRNDPKVAAGLEACRKLVIENSAGTPEPTATPG